jgi:argininosuccinate lyase
LSSLYRTSRLGAAQRKATRFISSIESDKYLFESVVQINQAHVIMLRRRRIIRLQDARKVLRALAQLRIMARPPDAEDVHVAIEDAVTRRAGKLAAGNLQFAKSRNDQVAAAIRMHLRSEVLHIMDSLIGLLRTLQITIRKHHRTLMIGRTHLQPAEPITYGHYLLAFHDEILRDFERLEELYARLNLSPMGACALAGTSIPIDRKMVATLLGFDGLVENSMDAVGSRDFALEFLADMTQLAVDIGRLAEDFVFYSTPEVGQLRLPNDLSFTSSIMPQKKNPDVIELIRARSAIPVGALIKSTTILHSLPTSYNLDMQEITPDLWITSGAMQDVISMLRTLISRIEPRPVEVGRADLVTTTATETANVLVTHLGVPFRLAHQIVASAASDFSKMRSKQADLWPELVLRKVRARLRGRSSSIETTLAHVANPEAVVSRKKSLGSPAPKETLRLLKTRATSLRQISSRQLGRKRRLESAKRRLQQEAARLVR